MSDVGESQTTTAQSVGRHDPSDRGRSDRPRPRTARRHLFWAAGLVVGLAGIGLGAYLAWPRTDLGPVVPSDLSRLDPELVALIRQQAEQVRANPRNAAAHGRLGLVYEANAMFSQARTCFANAAKLAERAPLWNYHLAIALRQTGDFDGSLELLGTLAEQHPKFAALQHRLGDALFESGRLEEAETAFQKAVQLNRSAPVPCVSLADVKIRQGDYAAAVDFLLPIRYRLYRIGGSHAQRDLFAQTLIEAALRCNRFTLARALTAERIAAMPGNAPAERLRARGPRAQLYRGDNEPR